MSEKKVSIQMLVFIFAAVVISQIGGYGQTLDCKEFIKVDISDTENITGTGSYVIVSIPSNASIFIDMVYHGLTPKTIYNISVGNHTVLLKKTGYKDWSRSGYLHANQTIYYNVTLTPDQNQTYMQLDITAPDVVRENTWFLVQITSNNTPVSNVTVSWMIHGTYFITGPNGTALVKAPPVLNASNYTIDYLKAEKNGYLPAMKMVMILRRLPGDVSGDGKVDFGDINPFVFAVSHNETVFAWKYPMGDYWAADCNQDGKVNFGDISPFIKLLTI
ncbi:MAG: PEGA domain-containing protein [Candidatus Thermoplasmatota archaeon]